MDFLNLLLNVLGVNGIAELVLYALYAVLAVVGLGVARFFGNSKVVETVVNVAKAAVAAVEKLSDKGQFDNLTPEERAAKKKALAVDYVKQALVAAGVKPSPMVLSVVDFAIEAAVKALK